MTDFNKRLEQFKSLIQNSENIVFFGGAGVSTASGIPDFRSKNGLYSRMDERFKSYTPEYLLSHDCLEHKPKIFYEFFNQKMNYSDIEPNIVHKKLAELEQTGKVLAIVTQNIDGLHQKAGSKNVFEIHGTAARGYCTKCGQFCMGDMLFSENNEIPRCTCGGILRPDVVLYKETLPETTWARAVDAMKDAGLLIIGGTSLSVYPARDLIDYSYCPIVIINNDITTMDNSANIVFHEDLGAVFEAL